LSAHPKATGWDWGTTGTLANLATLLGRFIIVAELFPNGIGKISEFAKMAAGMGGVQTTLHGHPFPGNARIFFPVPEFFLSCSILFDLAGATLIVLGLFARPVAAWLTFYCCLAIFIYHGDLSDPGNVMALLRNSPLVGGLLMIAGLGAGGWSLDARRNNRS